MFAHEHAGLIVRNLARNIKGMDGWGRVAAAVVDRRAELGWTQKDLAAEAGVSERTVQGLEAGRVPQARNRSKIERALGWENGEMRRIEEDPAHGKPRSATPERLLAVIYDELPPDRARRVAAVVEAELAGRPAPTGRR